METTEAPSLREAAYRLLREEIVSCRRRPGERLSERRLAESTGFGLAPIRAALARLEHDGLVQVLPRRGYRVTPLTPAGVDDLMEVWAILGPEILRLGIERATPARRRAIAAGFARVERASQIGRAHV